MALPESKEEFNFQVERWIQRLIDRVIRYADEFKEEPAAVLPQPAPPVGYFYAEKPGDWYQISDGDRVPDHRRIPLYSSPQSGQVVKLPNEFISNEGIVVQIEKVMAVLAVAGIQYERKGNACSAAMLQAQPCDDGEPTDDERIMAIEGIIPPISSGNSPAIPGGYVMVPKEPTEAMINTWLSEVANWRGHVAGYKAMLATAPQEQKS